MLRAISSGNRVDEKSGVQHTSTPFYNAFYYQQTKHASLKQLLGSVLEGKGVPPILLEAAVLPPVTRRQEPLQQFLGTPFRRTLGVRRVSSLSISTGSNPLSDLGADVQKELSAKKKGISIRGNRAERVGQDNRE